MSGHQPPSPGRNLGYKTRPLDVGAPLPEQMEAIVAPLPGMIVAELARAQVELMHAIARHRQAWHKMRAYKKQQDARQEREWGFEAYLDSDPQWKVRTGDVAWWRGEMQAQAAAVTALMDMLGGRSTGTLDGWVETTDHTDMGNGRRTFIRGV